MLQVLSKVLIIVNMLLKLQRLVSQGGPKRKSNNDDKHGHDQEARRPSIYVEGKKTNAKY